MCECVDRQYLAEFCGEMAGASPRAILRGQSGNRPADQRVVSSYRFCTRRLCLAIHHGDGQANGLHVTRLCAEELVLVCSPKLLVGDNALHKPADLARHTLLHINDPNDWAKWLAAAGVENVDVARGPIFNQASMALDAAVSGQGVALARSVLAAWDLSTDRLKRPFKLSLPVPYAYWIVCPKATAKSPKIALFRDWLSAEAAADILR
jgi:LysR family glycine cleavage system transcriptional activator